MSDSEDTGPRLYKARGADGEVAWVDHEALWRLQQGQVEELRRSHARRRRLALLALAGMVALALVLVVLRLRTGTEPPPPDALAAVSPAGAAANPPAGTAESAAVADSPATGAEADAPAARAAGVEPSSLEAAADPQPAPSPTERIASAVQSWAGAWARQDLSAYLASYAGEFEPVAGLSRSSWESLRRGRLQSPASIRVEIEELEIALREDGGAEARFLQSYWSPSYSDVVRKSLELIEERGEWRIVAERAAAP